MNSINWPASSVWVFIAQLGEHCSANAEATGSNPVEAPKNFFSGYFRNCLNCDSLRWSHTHFTLLTCRYRMHSFKGKPADGQNYLPPACGNLFTFQWTNILTSNITISWYTKGLYSVQYMYDTRITISNRIQHACMYRKEYKDCKSKWLWTIKTLRITIIWLHIKDTSTVFFNFWCRALSGNLSTPVKRASLCPHHTTSLKFRDKSKFVPPP